MRSYYFLLLIKYYVLNIYRILNSRKCEEEARRRKWEWGKWEVETSNFQYHFLLITTQFLLFAFINLKLTVIQLGIRKLEVRGHYRFYVVLSNLLKFSSFLCKMIAYRYVVNMLIKSNFT